MEMQEQHQGAVTVLRPAGALVGDDVTAFKTAVHEAIQKSMGRVVIDASAIPFVDSTGLEALVDLTEEMNQGGRALKLCAGTDTLREALDVTGWGDVFEYYEDVNSGVRSFL